MRKTPLPTIAAKNAVISAIIDALDTRECFLLIGHENADEDCISSLVSFALLVTKFDKKAYICLDGDMQKHYDYLLQICRYNSIHVNEGNTDSPIPADTIVICDTPKPEMMAYDESIDPLLANDDIIKIEIDHHLEADSAFCGQEGYRFVAEASSACELIGLIALKLCARDDLLTKYNITDLLSRNLVLSILTGIIGDTKMGKYIKTAKERRFYTIFSSLFDELLRNQTTKSTNISSQQAVFEEIDRLSGREARCAREFLKHTKYGKRTRYIVLDEEQSRLLHSEHTYDTVVAVSRSVADILADESDAFGLVVFYDDRSHSDFIQFRMRRNHAFRRYDLREVLHRFSINNGGGHEGAVGFRIPREDIDDIVEYTDNLLAGVEEDIGEL